VAVAHPQPRVKFCRSSPDKKPLVQTPVFGMKDLASPSLDIYDEGGDNGEVLAFQHQRPLNLAITSFLFNPFSLQSFRTPYFL
jgi:hypothetical protein